MNTYLELWDPDDLGGAQVGGRAGAFPMPLRARDPGRAGDGPGSRRSFPHPSTGHGFRGARGTSSTMRPPASDRLVVDGTVGPGGHTEALLKARPEVRVLGLDRDGEVLPVARRGWLPSDRACGSCTRPTRIWRTCWRGRAGGRPGACSSTWVLRRSSSTTLTAGSRFAASPSMRTCASIVRATDPRHSSS